MRERVQKGQEGSFLLRWSKHMQTFLSHWTQPENLTRILRTVVWGLWKVNVTGLPRTTDWSWCSCFSSGLNSHSPKPGSKHGGCGVGVEGWGAGRKTPWRKPLVLAYKAERATPKIQRDWRKVFCFLSFLLNSLAPQLPINLWQEQRRSKSGWEQKSRSQNRQRVHFLSISASVTPRGQGQNLLLFLFFPVAVAQLWKWAVSHLKWEASGQRTKMRNPRQLESTGTKVKREIRKAIPWSFLWTLGLTPSYTGCSLADQRLFDWCPWAADFCSGPRLTTESRTYETNPKSTSWTWKLNWLWNIAQKEI